MPPVSRTARPVAPSLNEGEDPIAPINPTATTLGACAPDHDRAVMLPPIARVGDSLDAIDTPALVVDLDKFEGNLHRMQSWATEHGVALRAHAKAHKCPEVALRQIALGAVGICCQKVSEAIPFVNAGVTDILISNEVVGAPKLALLAALTKRARVAVCVDDAGNLRAIGEAMRAAGTQVDIMVEVDVGQGRCGVATSEAVLALARQAGESEGLRFRGLQAYHGTVQHIRSPQERAKVCSAVSTRVRGIVDDLAAHGVTCESISGAGTGSAQFDAPGGVYTELQAGSYAFMDVDYGSNTWDDALRFDVSLTLLTTVMSVATPGRAVLDAGLKSMTVEAGMPTVAVSPDATRYRVIQVNDEHTILALDGGAAPALGDKVALVVPHVDPACNLHDAFVAVRNGRVERIWPISARGLSR